ncbi:MAG: L,D-transpeptidase [Nocardioides sp.]
MTGRRAHATGATPRYGRIAVLLSSVVVTTVAVLGGVGALPSSNAEGPLLTPRGATSAAPAGAPTTSRSLASRAGSGPTGEGAPHGLSRPSADPRQDTALPAGSGSGRRVVFSQSRQRVWLVTGGRHIARTYLVSGSLTDNLHPGTYAVYSRSEQAWGIDDSGTMRYFVRFAHGQNAAIGFHDIPVDDGHLVQTRAQLGTPQSHGCVRQARPDAIALWHFAPLGTTVVVTA